MADTYYSKYFGTGEELDEALLKATNAADYAAMASQSATAAASSAVAASNAAQSIGDHVRAAEEAKEGAEAAQKAAEDARDAAQGIVGGDFVTRTELFEEQGENINTVVIDGDETVNVDISGNTGISGDGFVRVADIPEGIDPFDYFNFTIDVTVEQMNEQTYTDSVSSGFGEVFGETDEREPVIVGKLFASCSSKADGIILFVFQDNAEVTRNMMGYNFAGVVFPKTGVYLRSLNAYNNEVSSSVVTISQTFVFDGIELTSTSRKIKAELLPENIGGGLPEHTTADNGKFLRVVDGAPAWDEAELLPQDMVRYTAQSLTEAQQAQARENIGAVASWADLPDKPFGETEEIVLPESLVTFAWSEEDSKYVAAVEDTSVVAKKNAIYKVIWDGTAYICSGVDVSAFIPKTSYIGNASVLGLTDTGEPFFILMQNELGYAFFDVYATKEMTRSIVIFELMNRSIDSKFLPQTMEPEQLILTSSTEGSTKRFQIKVDDTGTLQAVELSS